ncbi:MAG: lipoyl protein ligase domain-containing protein [Hydrogenobacter sp.]
MIEVRTGFENMKIDQDNLLALEEGRGEPVKRIYMWSEPTISIGYSQKPREFSVPVVRRPTGGGALLHGWDISFSIVDYKNSWGKSFSEIYRKLSQRLADAFGSIGVSVEICKNKGVQGDSYYCFFFPNLGELTVNGRKLVACAMRTLKRAFLLHGSVFLDLDYTVASQIIGVPEDELRRRIVCAQDLGLSKEDVLQVLSQGL